MNDPRAFAVSQLDRLLGFYPRVDSKASLVFGLNVALLGLIALNYPVRDLTSPRGLAGIVAVAFIGMSLWQLYRVFFPDLTPGGRRSIVFFGDIAAVDWRSYHQEVQAATDADLLEDLTCQIWRNAEILKRKFELTRRAFLLTLAAMPAWALLFAAATLRAGKFVVGA